MVNKKDLKGFKQLEAQLGRSGFERLISKTREEFISLIIARLPCPDKYISTEAYLRQHVGPHLSTRGAIKKLDKLAPATRQIVGDIIEMVGPAEFYRIVIKGHHKKIVRIFEQAKVFLTAESSSENLVQLIHDMEGAQNPHDILDNYLEKYPNPEASTRFKAIREELTSEMLISGFKNTIQERSEMLLNMIISRSSTDYSYETVLKQLDKIYQHHEKSSTQQSPSASQSLEARPARRRSMGRGLRDQH